MNLKNGRYHILFLLLLFVSREAYGQSPDDYLAIAAENNPGLKAAFHTYRASLEQVPQVGALPDPSLSFGLFVRPMHRFMGKQIAEVSVMQMFPWFGTRDAAKTEAMEMAKARYEKLREAKTALFYEVKATWYALYMVEREIAISQENIDILQTLEDLAINRFKSGDTGGKQVDVLWIQMEINELKNSLVLFDDNRRVLISQFNKLLNRPKDHPVVLPDSLIAATLPISVAEMPDSIRRNNPMLKMLEKEEEAFFAQGKMKRKMSVPTVGLGLQYSLFQPRSNSNLEMNGRDMLMPMATVSIPLWRKKYSAAIKEADLRREAVVAQRQDVSNALEVSYEEALKNFGDAERRADLYTRQTALAQQVLDILTVEYSSADGRFDDILRMQMKLLDFRLRALDAVVDQHVAVAMLERLMGR